MIMGNKENKTGRCSFVLNKFIFHCSPEFFNGILHFVLQVVSLHFHKAILFTLFCGLTFQRRSSAKKLSCDDFKQEKETDLL